MRNERPFLVFESRECEHVTRLLSTYLSRRQEITLPADDRESLEHSHSLAGDLSLYDLLWPGASHEALDKFCRESMGRPTLVSPDSLEAVRLDDSRGQLGTAIRWAARELVQGSVVVQRESEWVLTTEYQDLRVPSELGSTNQSLANTIAKGLVKTGMVAQYWVNGLPHAEPGPAA
jgi:hypothetical protein